MAIATPANVSAMPSARRQRTVSFRKKIANSTVSGAPVRLTIPAAEGDAVCRPTNRSANEPPLMASPMIRTRGRSLGTERSSGAKASITSSDRIAA